MKFEHQITITHMPESEGLYCFYGTTLNLKRALCADRRPLKRDTIASRDSVGMGARQNLALYYNFG